MYENIKYEELKQLPDDKKKEALQELMTTYGSNKAIAEATGGAVVAISNLYKHYVLGEAVGRKKGSKNSTKVEESKEKNQPETVIETSTETPVLVTEEKTKRKYTRKPKEITEIQSESLEQEIVRKPIILTDLKTLSFTSSLCGSLSGIEAKERVIGMINALLDGKTYSVNIQIDEQ